MDLSEIVIIVGAGAHAPYKFPTGKELKDSILRLNQVALSVSHKTELANDIGETKSLKIKKRVCELIDESRFISSTAFPMPHGKGEYDNILTKEVESFPHVSGDIAVRKHEIKTFPCMVKNT